MAISQEELERRVKELSQRMGRGSQQSGVQGKNRRASVDLDNLDLRRIGLGLGRRPDTEDQVAERGSQGVFDSIGGTSGEETTGLGAGNRPGSAALRSEGYAGDNAIDPGGDPEAPDAPDISNLAEALGHGGMPAGMKNMGAKGVLNALAQMGLLGDLYASPVSPINAGLGVARSAWEGIENVNEEADVAGALGLMNGGVGIDHRSPEAKNLIESSGIVNDPKDYLGISALGLGESEESQQIANLAEVRAASEDKPFWDKIMTWLEYEGQRGNDPHGGQDVLSSEMTGGVPGLAVSDPGGGPQVSEVEEATGQPVYQDQLMSDESIAQADREDAARDFSESDMGGVAASSMGMTPSEYADFDATYGGGSGGDNDK